jgi:hypothetical protein
MGVNVKMVTQDNDSDQYVLKRQIIRRKVDPTRIVPDYYRQVKNDIRRKIDIDAELLIIEIVPKSEITKKWIVETLMYLQREFTSIITVPENTSDIKKEDFEEFERRYDCVISRH